MSKVYNIRYVDAAYIYKEELGGNELHPVLSPHEAYGYVKEENENIIITFIKKISDHGSNTKESKIITEGLLIPTRALLSRKDHSTIKDLSDVEPGESIAITWRDVSHVINSTNRECPTMYTEGIVLKNESDHVVLKNPETIRTYPLPIKNHPAVAPDFYKIPKSLISELKILDKKHA